MGLPKRHLHDGDNMRKILHVLILSLVLLPVLCLAGPLQEKQRSVIAKKNTVVGGGSECTGMLVCQNAEGTGYDNSETWTETSTTNEDYTTVHLRGSQSIQSGTGVANGESYYDMTDSGTVYGHFLFETSAIPVGDHDKIFALMNSTVDTFYMYIQLRDAGTLALVCGTSFLGPGATTLSVNTMYHIWFKYIKGTGANAQCSLWIGTTTSRPASAELSTTTGDATVDAATVWLHSYSEAGHWNIYDQILLKTTEFTTVDN
jgi:hypothetical protein